MMIIAVDFDGVLVSNQFPEVGQPQQEMISVVKRLIASGAEVILWTCRVDEPLEKAVKWCEMNGLKFAAINDNAPSNKKMYESEFPNGTRKVYADYYVDDHNLGYNKREVLMQLDMLCNRV